MKLDLIHPTHRHFRRTRPINIIPPLGLAMVAAVTPKDVEIRLIDAYLEKIDYDRPVDLVGVTALTPAVNMAYEIADEYRRRGVKTVMGGIHASAMPDETLEHFDAVVIGEAEDIWPEVIEDFRAGRMQRKYRSKTVPDITMLPRPRRDLFNVRSYFVRRPVETSRGCIFKCEYCSDPIVFGAGYRFRDVNDVVDEIRSIRPRGKYIFFVDNNIVGQVQRASRLFEALIPLKIRWTAQASITMAYNEETLELATRSGCIGVLVGMETINKEVLHRIGKPVDPGRYRELVQRFHKYGILVQGEFIFGFDEDTPKIFKDTVEFAQSIGIDTARFAILKPYPGTKLYQRWLEEGRIITGNWSLYHTSNVAFRPLNVTQKQLTEGRNWAYEEFSRPINIWNRVGLRRKYAWLAWLINLVNSGTKNTRKDRKPLFYRIKHR
ncbi:MAG: radical SAM protein [Candidatus Scalindua sp.]